MKLGLILGDQLSLNLATLTALDKSRDRLVLAEVAEEAGYVPHHPQKIAFLFSAMRHFAAELAAQGWALDYYRYGDHDLPSLAEVLADQRRRHPVGEIVATHCGEYRLHQQMLVWPQPLECPVTVLDDSRFLCTPQWFARWAAGRKQLRMEFFYREMRRHTGYLMAGNQPEGGTWNFDADNRKPWRGTPALAFLRDAIDREVLALVARQFPHHPGRLDSFQWATTRTDARRALAHFIDHGLAHFGDYQDAMATGQDQLFHSLLSPYLNAGLLDAREICDAAIAAYRQQRAPLNAVEGFIRQIIGWREYVRGLYWLAMPDYKQRNHFGNQRPLPEFYWHGDTRMQCMKECLRNTLDHGYAHHIQRLMVTGNFALLAGIAPQHICDWYLSVYVDAYEWVELPNTLGMVMHADGGYLASKPYAASGAYIHRMSDFCQRCAYNVKTQAEHDSCPFNSLYWHFLHRHRDVLASNQRLAMAYRNLERMDADKLAAILRRAEEVLASMETL